MSKWVVTLQWRNHYNPPGTITEEMWHFSCDTIDKEPDIHLKELNDKYGKWHTDTENRQVRSRYIILYAGKIQTEPSNKEAIVALIFIILYVALLSKVCGMW